MKKYDYEKLKKKVDDCKNTDIKSINIDDLDDLESIYIDKRKSSNERILDFLNEVKNPYVFKVKGRIVRIRFSENGISADDCLSSVLKNLYR